MTDQPQPLQACSSSVNGRTEPRENSVASGVSASSSNSEESVGSVSMDDEENEESSSGVVKDSRIEARKKSVSSGVSAYSVNVEASVGSASIDDEENRGSSSGVVKDPRKKARKYQLELCKKAVEENVIVYLGTGCGKTHIAVLVIYELSHLIKKPTENVCVFLAPTIPLVTQQAAVIEESTDFKVGCYHGHSKRLKSHQEWQKEIEKFEVLVMTPQILLCNLYHRFIKMELIELLIFDECHHAQPKSSHPYAEIMKEYKKVTTKRPRIFGMTASPIVGKGGSDPGSLPKSINSLENLLDSKVYSVDDKEELEELERFVATPKIKCYSYGPPADCSTRKIFFEKLEEIKSECMVSLGRKGDDLKLLKNNRMMLQRLQDNLVFCLANLGLCGVVRAVRILLAGDQCEWTEFMEAESISALNSVANQYLAKAALAFHSDLRKDGIGPDTSSLEALEEPFFSKKLLVLIGILTTCRLQPDMKCIIFVSRVLVARTLACILENLKCLEFWKCHFLVGVHSGLKNMSRKAMDNIVQKFRSGELNLLVATRVGEEGLDIQTCCLVIRYDLPETVASFIQSRGRARMPQSEYVFLIERDNRMEMDLIESFISDEDCMNQEITCRTSKDAFDGFEEDYYKVHSTGASISAGYSVSLLHQYCSKLPHDEYFSPMPYFSFFNSDDGGVRCEILLPSNAPIHLVEGSSQPSKEIAKKTACLKACKELHEHGALTDHLCPGQDDEMEEGSSDSDSEDESSRGELHEMITPAALQVPLISSESSVSLQCYVIQFIPVPEDRLYQQFGFFLNSSLPKEAEAMELDLHLAHGRIVKTKFVHFGVIEFNHYEIMEAQKIQELFLKIILDRSEFFADFILLGKNASSSSTIYLLLPMRWNQRENKFTVDWKIIKSCLSSPVFRTPRHITDYDVLPAPNSLILADGTVSTSGIVNSLVFTPHNKLFFFVDEVLHETDANSPFTDESRSSYVEHYSQKFGIHLSHPKQPLLKAKQLFSLRNLLHNRVQENTEARELEEHFVEIPPELCSLKIIGFSKDIGSSLSLLPSIMHRLENLLLAIELKGIFSASFEEGAEVSALRILEALTTEKCLERFSLERLEVLGDAFLKYAVGRHLFLLYDALDEGQLTRKRSSVVNNTHLYKLAIRRSLQVYIRDEQFDPCQFYALGRPCKVICNEDTEIIIHSQEKSKGTQGGEYSSSLKCNKNHHWLHKKTIADIVEALVGAFLVDSGFKAAIAFLKWLGMQVDFEASQFSKICTASKSYEMLSSSIDIGAVEISLGYRFVHKGLLVQAFVHPSYNKHSGGCYQRLEFLGDAVLDYLITSYLYSVYPKLKPGQLTDLRSASVNNVSFAHVAVGRCFHKYIISESNSLCEDVKKFVSFLQMYPSGKGPVERPTCPKALGDLVESSIGAILLDSGFNLNLVWNIMLSFLDRIMTFANLHLNPLRQLQELCQARNWELQINDIQKGGAFIVYVQVSGDSVLSKSSATHVSKKTATRRASEEIFLKLKAQGYRAKKSKTLEEILKSTKKQEAKLIGFDETPAQAVLLDSFQLETLTIQNSLIDNNSTSQTLSTSKEPTSTPTYDCFRRKSMSSCEKPERHNDAVSEGSISGTDSKTGGFSCVGSAKSRLFELCARNYWNPPVFERVKDEGPSHLKLFTFKVTLQIEEASIALLECFSEPRSKKKAAEDHAAEGALWYLQNQGYVPKLK